MIFAIGISILLILMAFVGIIYGIYIAAIFSGKSYHSPGKLSTPLPISIIIPTYNEEAVIESKIKNLAEINYPSELMEVIIIDDCSEDETRERAVAAFQKYHIQGTVLKNQSRQGTNANYNRGFALARNDLIITTDADVTLENDALLYILGVLVVEEETGAACGELIPWIEGQSLSTGIEGPYRDVFGKICGWESHVHSTYCFNGPLIAIKRQAISQISPTRGASDTNIALMAIQKGYRAKYVPEAKFYEWIALRHGQQQRQKIRRATRLLESTWSARHCLFDTRYGKFGMIVLPLRFAMLFLVPMATAVSILIGLILGFLLHPLCGMSILMAVTIIMISAKWHHNILSSFLWHQYYLLLGLMHITKPSYLWHSIDRKTRCC